MCYLASWLLVLGCYLIEVEYPTFNETWAKGDWNNVRYKIKIIELERTDNPQQYDLSTNSKVSILDRTSGWMRIVRRAWIIGRKILRDNSVDLKDGHPVHGWLGIDDPLQCLWSLA